MKNKAPVRPASARYEDWNGGESRRLTGGGVDVETGEITSPTTVTRSARVEAEGLQVFVGTSYRPETGATHGKLEFNPSRLLVKGVSSVRAAVSVAHSIFNSDQVQSLVEPSCQFEAAKLKRLDVTRDFTVDSVSATINSLERSLGRMRGKCRGSQTLRTVRRREGQGEPVAQVTAHSAIAAIAARL